MPFRRPEPHPETTQPQAATARSTPASPASEPSPAPKTPIGATNAPPRPRAGAPGVPKAGERSRPHTPPRRPPQILRRMSRTRHRTTPPNRQLRIVEKAHTAAARATPKTFGTLRVIAMRPVANRLAVHAHRPPGLRATDALRNRRRHRKTPVLRRVLPRTRKEPQILRRVRRPRALHCRACEETAWRERPIIV